MLSSESVKSVKSVVKNWRAQAVRLDSCFGRCRARFISARGQRAVVELLYERRLIEAETTISDSDLMASYNTISVQRIALLGKTGSEGDALAQKVLGDIKGGMSFEDAINQGIARATKTLRNVKGAWIKEQRVDIDNGRIQRYQVNMLVTFVLDD